MKITKHPIFSAEEHEIISRNLFIARNQLVTPIGPAIAAITPANAKKKVLKSRDMVISSLDDLREYLEGQIATRDVGASQAFDLYFRPGGLEHDQKILCCSDEKLAIAFHEGLKAKIGGTESFTVSDVFALHDFLDTAVVGKVELPLDILADTMNDRKRGKEIQAVRRILTSNRLEFCKALRTITFDRKTV